MLDEFIEQISDPPRTSIPLRTHTT